MKTIYTKPQTQKIVLPGEDTMAVVRVSTCDTDCPKEASCPDENGALGKEATPGGGLPSYSVWSAWDDPDPAAAAKDSI